MQPTNYATTFLVIVPSLLSAQSVPPTDPNARESAVRILEKSDAAARAVHTVQYNGHFMPKGIWREFAAEVEGKAVLGTPDESGRRRFRLDVKLKPPGSDQGAEFTAGADGETYYLVDHAQRKVYTGNDRSVLGSRARDVQSIAMVEFGHPAPFHDEMNGVRIEPRDAATIEDHPCDVIHIVYAGEQGQATWHLSRRDHLPRRVDRVLPQPQGTQYYESELTVTGLVVNPLFVDDPFRLRIPDGYQRVEEPAP